MSKRVDLAEGVTLYLGDCREILPTLGKVDAVVTDPPYGIDLKTKTSDFRGSKWFDNGASIQATKLYDDNENHVAELVRSAIPNALAIAERGLIFPGPKMQFSYPVPSAVGAVYLPNGAGRCAWGFQCYQPILYYGKDPYLQDGRGARANSFKDEQPTREKIDP